MSLRFIWNLLRKITPQFLLKFYGGLKKARRRKVLAIQQKSGHGIGKEELIKQLRELGLKEGDTVLVHASFSKIGYVKDGPMTLIEAFLEVIGVNGHLLMPSSPNGGLQLEYIQQLECFEVNETPSKLGVLSETFRKYPQVRRSASPTEPVCCFGPNSQYYIDAHEGELTPYNQNSPFYKVAEAKGKILYIGVTLDNAGTSLHVLEDVCDSFDIPVYYPQQFAYKVKLPSNEIKEYLTFVHDPSWSIKRKCDELIPLFEKTNVLEHRLLGQAKVLVLDAELMLSVMIDAYKRNKTTMYSPNGEA